MTERLLPFRPRGVRRSWVLDSKASCASIGAYMAGHPLIDPEWGEPVEAQQFKNRRGQVRRVQARYANGRIVDYSRRRDGSVIRFYRVTP